MRDEEDHPALIIGHHDVPSLTFTLPAGMNAGPMLDGFMKSVIEARRSLACRVLQFERLTKDHAASGDLLRQALCRGQALGAQHAISTLDEEIVEAFYLWQQYEVQVQVEE
jgi:hypothetical protein